MTDVAGNIGTTSSTLAVTIDTAAPVFTGSTTGAVVENTSTSTTVYTATTTDGTAVTYSLSGSDASKFSINATTGVMKFLSSPNAEAPTDVGADNVYNVTVTAADAVGQTSTRSVAITVIDVNEAPMAVGSIASQSVVVGQAYTLSRTTVAGAFTDVDPGSVLTYSMSGQPSGFSINSSTGAITGTASVAGSHTVTVTATDQGGLSATQSFAMTESAATTSAAPVAMGATPDLLSSSDLGISSTDNITSNTTPTMRVKLTATSGIAEGGKVELVEGTSVLGKVTLTTSDMITGYVDIKTPTLTDGAHALSARLTDQAGNAASTGTVQVTIDTTAPTAAGVPDLAAASDNGTSSTDNITSVTTPVMRISLGTSGAAAGDTVDLLDGSTVRGTATLTATNITNGYVDITSMALRYAGHYMSSRVTDVAGNVGAISSGLEVSIATLIPTQTVTIASVTDDVGVRKGTLTTGQSTDDTKLTLSGTLSAALNELDFLLIYDGTTVLNYPVEVSGTSWSFTTPDLGTGAHSLTGRVVNAVTNAGSTYSSAFVATIVASDPLNIVDVAGVKTFSLTSSASIDLTAASHVQIEKINLGTASTSTLKLALGDVLQADANSFGGSGWTNLSVGAGQKQLLVTGASGAKVTVADGNWTAAGQASYGGVDYAVYNSTGNAAQLLIDTHLSRSGVII